MQTTLDALEKALAPIEHIGIGETTFEADGIKVSLRVMLPEEENEVQRYASKALPVPLGDEEKGQENKGVDQLDYIERFKIAVLSQVLVQVGDEDLRDIQYVETGEELENGKKVRIEKHVALRQLLYKWSGALRTRVFQKYAELLNCMEREAEAAIEFEPSDVATEIERLEEKLERLRKSEEQKNASVTSSLSSQVQGIATMEKPFADEGEAPPGSDFPTSAPEAETASQEPQGSPQPRKPIIPQRVEAPTPPERPQPTEGAVRPPTSGVITEDVIPPQTAGTMVPPETPDSFMDMSDSDGVRAAVGAEEGRILERRRQQAEEAAQATPASPGVLEGPSDPEVTRRPPHADAADVAAQPEATFTEAGAVDGVAAYRLPTESLTRRKDQQTPIEPAPINQTKTPQSHNPRFKAPPK